MLLIKFLLSLLLLGSPASEELPMTSVAESTQESSIVDCATLPLKVADELGTMNPTFNQIFNYGMKHPERLHQAQECGYFELIAASIPEPMLESTPEPKVIREIVPMPFCFSNCGPTPTAELEKHISIGSN